MGYFFLFLFLETTQVYSLRAGDSMGKVLEASGIQSPIKAEIINVLKKQINLKRCKVGDKLYITKIDNRFVKLKYEGKHTGWVIDSLMHFSKLSERTKLIYLTGVVETGSLWDALIEAHGTPRLVYEFADEVFPWDIDFNVETQKGDRFEVFAIAKYVGERFIGYGKILFARYISKNKEFVGVYYSKVGTGYYDFKGRSLQRIFLRAPLSYQRISSGYSRKRFHPILRRWMPHLGIDYAAPMGTPVRSVGDGRVIFAGWRRGFGKQIIIRHGNGFKSYYGHLSSFKKGIRKGKYVKQGELIGKVGSTGLSTGPHLDFRLRKHKKWASPLKLAPPRAKPLSGKELGEYKDYTKNLSALISGIRVLRKLPPVPLSEG